MNNNAVLSTSKLVLPLYTHFINISEDMVNFNVNFKV